MGRLISLLLAFALAGCAPSLQQRLRSTPWRVGGYVPTTADTARCRAATAHLEKQAPVSYEEELEDDEFGYAYSDGRIVLNANLSSCARLETLAHELGHLHQPIVLNRFERQMFADAISLKVVRVLGGYDPIDRYVNYLVALKGQAYVLTDFGLEIDRAATAIIAGRK